MTTTMRRRVYVLQVGLIGILVFCAGFLFWGNSFIHNQISTELTNQQIFFPAAGSAGLSPSSPLPKSGIPDMPATRRISLPLIPPPNMPEPESCRIIWRISVYCLIS